MENEKWKMKRFRQHTGLVAPLDRANVDTDQIIPKQFLKRVERTGFGEFLFYDWAKEPGWELSVNPILATGRNFGSGSSREHAPWALEDYGFEAVVAPSFADIFRNNCLKIGLLPIELREESVRALMDAALDDPDTRIEIDLDSLTVRAPGLDETFDMEQFTRWRLMEGLDDIGLTLRHTDAIDAFESSRPAWLPSA